EGHLIRGAVLLVTLGLALYGLSRLSHARHRSEPGTPRLAGRLGQLIPTVGVIEQRHRGMLREGNFWEPAQSLARQVFETTLADPLLTEGPTLPPVHVEGSWRQRRKLSRQVKELWRLAFRDEPTRISSRQLATVRAAVASVRSVLVDGRLRMGP